jgi:hypothetical protein
MAKLVIQHATDPGIAVIFEEVLEGGDDHRAQGFHGECTECGKKMHRWLMEGAVRSGQQHVRTHESGL